MLKKISHILLASYLMLTMAMPMFILYAVSAIQPYLKNSNEQLYILGYFPLISFGSASLFSLFIKQVLKNISVEKGLCILFLCTSLSFSLIIESSSIFIIILAMLLSGFSQALSNPLTNRVIANYIPDKNKAFMVGFKQSGVQLAGLTAGLLVPYLLGYFTWKFTLGSLFPFAIFLFICTPFLKFLYVKKTKSNEIKKNVGSQKSEINLSKYLILYQGVVGFLISLFLMQITSWASLNGINNQSSAFLITIFSLSGFFARQIITPLSGRIKNEILMLGILILLAFLSFLIVFQMPKITYFSLIFGTILIGTSLPSTNSIVMSLIIRKPYYGKIEETSAKVSSAFFMGIAIGGYTGGLLSHNEQALIFSVISTLMILFALFNAFLLDKKIKLINLP